MEPERVADFIEFSESLDPFPEWKQYQIGECTPDHSWWDDECWYTEEEKDAIVTNRIWREYYGVRLSKPVNQRKVEWGTGVTMP